MLARLLGLNNLDFRNDAGEKIAGINLYLALDDPTVTGQSCGKFFIGHDSPVELPKNLAPGMELEVSFNQKGKIVGVSTLKP